MTRVSEEKQETMMASAQTDEGMAPHTGRPYIPAEASLSIKPYPLCVISLEARFMKC